MAKKEESTNMVERFAEFKELKNIDKTTMISVLTESFQSVLKSMFNTDENLEVILNPDKGDVEIFQDLEVVPDDTPADQFNQYLHIRVSEARANGDPEAEVGETFTKKIDFASFGRRAILNLRQTLQSRILEIQKEALYKKFKDLIGDLVVGEVYQTWSRETLLLDDEKNEMLLPKRFAIPGDFFHKGETIRAVIETVDNNNNNPKVILSRTSENFLRRLFELEVPEIHDGLINIRAVARIPGERAKIAVESYDERIDPVGACVGVKGSRIHGIVRELRNENIDVISYTSNPQLFIQRALAPAKVSQIRIDSEAKKAEVFLQPDQVSLAIGKNGLNIKLASMLTGYEIDVYRENQQYDDDDIYLTEFTDEIEPWIIDQLKTIGALTAKTVLRMSRADLIERADLEEQTVDHLLRVLLDEYYDDPEFASLAASLPAEEEAAAIDDDDEEEDEAEEADDAAADEAAPTEE